MGGPICISDVIWLKTLIHWVESNRGVDHPKISAMTSWHWLISVTRNSRSLYYFILSHTHRYSYIYNNLQYLHTCWIYVYMYMLNIVLRISYQPYFEITEDSDDDSGWPKLRRVATRREVRYKPSLSVEFTKIWAASVRLRILWVWSYWCFLKSFL